MKTIIGALALLVAGCNPEFPVLESDSVIGIQADNLDAEQQEIILSVIDDWNAKTGYRMQGALFTGDRLPAFAIVGVSTRSFDCAGYAADGCTERAIRADLIVTRVSNGLRGEDLKILIAHEMGHMLGAPELDKGLMCPFNNTVSEIDDTVLFELGFRNDIRPEHAGKNCDETYIAPE